MKSLYKILPLLMLVLLGFEGQAKRGDVEKKKVIDKSYNVNDGTKLSIDNTFGKVHVNTWDKKMISVNVEMIARRRNEETALETLDQIEIDISESSSEIVFTTNIKGQMNKSNNETFEINYTVNMPSVNPLELKNSFGDSYIDDRSGTNDIKISYVDFKFENLMGQSDIALSFSDGSIEQMARGEMVVKYSDVDVEVLGIVKIRQEFSDMNIEKATTIDLTSKYGDLNIGEVEGLKGYVGFSGFRLGRLGVELDLETSYSGDFKIEKISKNFKNVNLTGKFGAFKLDFEEGTNATFDVNTKFCEFKYGADVEMNYRVKGDFNGEYKGKMGNGKGGMIKVSSSYGDIIFD